MTTVAASPRHALRLNQMKRNDAHLGQTGKGLMIDDPVTVALITDLSERLGLSKREVVRQSLARVFNEMIDEFDVVELTEDVGEFSIGTRGVVVMLHIDAFEVEFAHASGETVAVAAQSLKLVRKGSATDA